LLECAAVFDGGWQSLHSGEGLKLHAETLCGFVEFAHLTRIAGCKIDSRHRLGRRPGQQGRSQRPTHEDILCYDRSTRCWPWPRCCAPAAMLDPPGVLPAMAPPPRAL